MAQNQRESNRLRHIIEEKDREIGMLKENEEDSGRMYSGVTEKLSHRFEELEGMVKELTEGSGVTEELSPRIQELEGMVKGLTEGSGVTEKLSHRFEELEGMVKELTEGSGVTEKLSHRFEELEGMVKELTEGSGRTDARIAQGISQRVNQLEGMVKGLTEELLDLKAEVRKLSKVLEGKEELTPRPEIRRARSVSERTVRRPEESPQPESRSMEPERHTANIMQADGTIAQEPRKSDELIIAGNRPANMYQSKTNREYRGREEKKPLIYADEDDTVEIKKK